MITKDDLFEFEQRLHQSLELVAGMQCPYCRRHIPKEVYHTCDEMQIAYGLGTKEIYERVAAAKVATPMTLPPTVAIAIDKIKEALPYSIVGNKLGDAIEELLRLTGPYLRRSSEKPDVTG